MNNPKAGVASGVMQDAAEWYWQIREPDVSQAELDAWQAWLARDPVHREAFERVERAVDAVACIESPPWPTEKELLADNYDGSMPVSRWLTTDGDRRKAGRADHAAAAETRGFRGRGRLGWALAASVLAIAVVAAVMSNGFDSRSRIPDVAVYQTAPAEHRDVMLPDGSSISLGGRTTVSVAFGRDVRSIELRQGEAFFDVASDRDRPFRVTASGRAITAVGTAFNVARQAGRVTLTVTEGEVLVEPEAGMDAARPAPAETSADATTARLEAGQRIVYDSQAIEPISFADPDDALAWRSGVLKYRGEALKYVIEDVNRYTRQPIRIVDESAAGLSFTGTVFQDGAEAWVYGLEDAFPVVVESTASGVRIHSRRL